MKLTLLLLVTGFLQIAVAGHAQTFTYSKKGASLEQVFKEINGQTGYSFLYTNEMLQGAKPVDLDVSNSQLLSVLKEIFKGQPLSYTVKNKVIILQRATIPKPASAPITIKGRVIDEKLLPLPGATVKIKNTTKGVSTDNNGNYTIVVPDGDAVLTFSMVGFQDKEVKVGIQTTIDVILLVKPLGLDQVVVIGYGSQRREDVNGSISSVKAADIEGIPQSSVDQLLQGKAAGVTVTQNSGAPGSQTSVHIRGIASFGSAEPLYVIDGVEVAGAANTNGNPSFSQSGNAPPSPLSLLNPNDIETIDILKDASAAAIYGNRAANGVIIITTKKGKMGSARINYDGYSGIQEGQKFLKLMNLRQYAKLQNSLADAYGTTRRDELANPDLLGDGTDWQDAIFHSAPMQSHQLSVSGGKDGLSYYMSGGYETVAG